MSLISIIGVGFGLSMDAFAVSICKGLCQRRMDWIKSIVIGLFFGFFQAIMPIIGFFLGHQFAGYLEKFDHWIAFVLLAIIGTHMIKEASEVQTEEEISCDIGGELNIDFRNMIALSIATSIDALAVGVSFALMKINILESSLIIGVTTFILSTIGVFIGYKFGAKFKSKSEILGGIVLILIGLKILLEGIL